MPIPSRETRRPIRRLAWALLLGGGITFAFGAGDAEEDNYFDPLPKSSAAAKKAAEKERVQKERAERKRADVARAERERLERERRQRQEEEDREREARAHADEDKAAQDATEEEDTYFSLPAPPEKAAPRRAPSAAAADESFADMAERVLPSVVSVTRRRGGGGGGLGSGVLAGPQGYVLTSNHVIDGEGALKVRLADGRELDAQRVAADPATDVAVLRLSASKEVKASLRPIRFGDSEALRVGETVAALGSPYGLSETVTTGIVSAKGRRHSGLSEYGRLIQTDAAINPGSSGGALVNRRGELVGINTAIVSRGGGSQGIGFAIPSNLARKVMDDLLRDGKVSRGWLGVSARNGAAESNRGKTLTGARVDAVTADGPGDKAGLRRGDLIVAMSEAPGGSKRPVRDADDLLEQVALARPGSRVVLDVIRGKTRRDIEVRLGRRAPEAKAVLARSGSEDWEPGESLDGEDGPGAARLGMSVATAAAALRKRYRLQPEDAGRLVITSVEKGGGADDADLRAGDVLLEADGKRIGGIAGLRAAVAKAGGAGRSAKLRLTVRRDGEVLRKSVRLIPDSI